MIVKMMKADGIELDVTDEALSVITRAGYDPQFGARPVKRAIQDKLLNALSKSIISGEIVHDKKVRVLADGDELRFEQLV